MGRVVEVHGGAGESFAGPTVFSPSGTAYGSPDTRMQSMLVTECNAHINGGLMHDKPLHCPVRTECLCCHVEQEFIFKSQSDHVVCKSCLRHQGNTIAKANQRNTDHIGLWKSEVAIANEDHADEVTRLHDVIEQQTRELASQRTEIEDMRAVVRAGIDNAPLATVEQWFANEQVAAAMTQRDSAYQSRDHAYRALWAADRLHHEDESRDEYCSCGQRADRCKEFGALAPAVNALMRWENKQIERLKSGLPDGLPDNHPEVLKLGYQRRRIQRRQAG